MSAFLCSCVLCCAPPLPWARLAPTTPPLILRREASRVSCVVRLSGPRTYPARGTNSSPEAPRSAPGKLGPWNWRKHLEPSRRASWRRGWGVLSTSDPLLLGGTRLHEELVARGADVAAGGAHSWNPAARLPLVATLDAARHPQTLTTKACQHGFDVIRLLNFKKEKFVWVEEQQSFLAVCGLDQSKELAHVMNNPQGLSREQQTLRRIVYGNNDIQVPLQSVATLILLEVLNPFYMFQVFSLAVWFAEGYYYYTIAIIVMSFYGIASNVLQTYRSQHNLHSTVHSVDRAEVLRGDSETEHIDAAQLVPGDVIVIPPHGCTMQCDAVLLRGTCIVNESMLTVTKTPPQSNFTELAVQEQAHHTIFCGTHVIQTRYYGGEKVLAVVTNTSFMTAKGNLVRAILYPPPVSFKFDRDSYKFIGVLALVASVGLIYTVVLKIVRGISASDIIIKALDIVTIVIPPALPAAMTVGRLYAQTRLKDKNIFCINSHVINVAGSLDCVCFDKTGTLTEDGLDMWGVLPVLQGEFQSPCYKAVELPNDSPLPVAMAACHMLTRVDGSLLGDPLDLKFTGWELEEPAVEDTSKYDSLVPTIVQQEYGIIQQFQFSSTLQRMSVITRQLGRKEFLVICKGSPEMISSLSQPDSIPKDFQVHLSKYSEQGYRILAIGWRFMSDISYAAMQRISREQVETDLTFGGLIIMENRLKPETEGDNILTAVSVARECGLITPGERVINVQATWAIVRESFAEILPRLIVRGAVFARMSPDQKQQLVGHLQELAMCGDGANDCGALKAAHVGISLSEAESSVASPFTSKEANISCVPLVVKEGRAALVTSFGVFKYMAAYSLTQFVSVMILYSIESNLTDFEFLFIDLCLSLTFAFFFGHTQAYSGALVSDPPLTSLISPIPILSLVLQMVINISMQCLIFLLVQIQPWYKSAELTDTNEYACFENYSIFTLSLFQYIGLAIVFSKGPPYREPIWTNYGLSASVLVLTALCSYITVWPAEWLSTLLELMVPPIVKFRILILLIGVAGFALSLAVESVLVDFLLMKKLQFQQAFTNRPKFMDTKQELEKDEKWPAISTHGGSPRQITPPPVRPQITMTVLTETSNSIFQSHHEHSS
ncbi:hypothetical protein B566_EDAN004444 [Ephemera danica]|nr:hypothetical protein B566_EDAN004444 [Ephemera danica]